MSKKSQQELRIVHFLITKIRAVSNFMWLNWEHVKNYLTNMVHTIDSHMHTFSIGLSRYGQSNQETTREASWGKYGYKIKLFWIVLIINSGHSVYEDGWNGAGEEKEERRMYYIIVGGPMVKGSQKHIRWGSTVCNRHFQKVSLTDRRNLE